MTPPALRRGGAADLDEAMVTMVEAFERRFGEAWTHAQCAAILSLPGVWLLLARVDDQAAGFALTRVISDEAELLLLGVRPRFRRRRIASALISAAEADAAARGANRLHLEVRAENPAALLYERAGFEAVGRRPGYYVGESGQVSDALTLAKPIVPN